MFNFMFDDIGNKIKKLVKVIFSIELLFFFIVAIICFVQSSNSVDDEEKITLIFIGLGCLSFGVLISWLSVVLIYAFGELVADTHRIKAKLYNEIIEEQVEASKLHKFTIPDLPGVVVEETSSDTWFCPECSRHNTNKVNECKCGYVKNEM